MKKEDAELKANALKKDLVGKKAEHKESKLKCIIASVEAVAKREDRNDYNVLCFLRPIENDETQKSFNEDIDIFLASYKVLGILNVNKSVTVS